MLSTVMRNGRLLAAVCIALAGGRALAAPMTAEMFDRSSHVALANVQWEVTGTTAVIDFAPIAAGTQILSVAFNTDPVNFPCVGCSVPPPPPGPGVAVNDSLLTVTTPGVASTVRFDGTDEYDWDAFGMSASSVSVHIAGLPAGADNSDIAVRNNLIESLYGLTGQFGIGLRSNGNVTWAYTDFEITAPPDPPTESAVPEPSTLGLAALGLTGLGLLALRRKSRKRKFER